MWLSDQPVPAIDEHLLPMALFLVGAPIGIAVAFWTRGVTGFIGLYFGGLVGTTIAIGQEAGGTPSAVGWAGLVNLLLVALVPAMPLPGYVAGRLVDRAVDGLPPRTVRWRMLIRSSAIVSPLVLLVIVSVLNQASIDRARQGSCPKIEPAPDVGGRLAFVGVNAVCVADLATGEIVFMFEGDVAVDRSFRTPSWAPDGSAFALQVTTGNRPTTVIVPLDGTPPTTVAPPDGAVWSASGPDWSPDGRRLATVVETAGCGDCARLAFYEVATSRWGLPSTTPRAGLAEPDWSPDGEQLIVRGDVDVGGPYARAVVVRKDGSLVVTVADDMSAYTGAAAWSPDGRRVAVPRIDERGIAGLWVMAADGSGGGQVAFTGDSSRPAWSPDGRWLAFDRYDETSTAGQIWYVSADGGTPKMLVDGGTHSAWTP